MMRQDETIEAGFFGAEDVVSVALTLKIKTVFERRLKALLASAFPSNVGVVHGFGMVAQRDLMEGEEIMDPAARFELSTPSSDAVRDGNVILCQDGLTEGYFLLRKKGRTAPSYYLNEARFPSQPNVEWLVDRRGHQSACLYWRILQDVKLGQELLVVYDPEDPLFPSSSVDESADSDSCES